ncbi:hypothetical protein [Streptomyces sp. NPDC048636]|uniref:nSTAND1 domain-containing NTPase n=1 Tax=Streptomyces sp. NPDC048636 TaxID=3155762 RepID=UPI00343B888E
MELTRNAPFTADVGPSRSGKSSLPRAGLIPALRNPGNAGGALSAPPPAASRQPPAASRQPPAASRQPPAASRQPPAAS